MSVKENRQTRHYFLFGVKRWYFLQSNPDFQKLIIAWVRVIFTKGHPADTPTCAPRRWMFVLARVALGRLSSVCCPYLGCCLFHRLACWCIIIQRMDLFIFLAFRARRWCYNLILYAGFGLVTLSYLQTFLQQTTKTTHQFDMSQLYSLTLPGHKGKWPLPIPDQHIRISQFALRILYARMTLKSNWTAPYNGIHRHVTDLQKILPII